jgi:hypothetical protein
MLWDGGDGLTVASGTAIKIGPRYFYATVAHAKVWSPDHLRLVPKQTHAENDEPIPFVRHVLAEGNVDVGAFEITHENFEQLGVVPIDIDRIYDAGTAEDRPSRLVGFPARYVRPASVGDKSVTLLSYACEPVGPTRWGAISKRKLNLDRNIDIVINYDRDVIDWTKDSKLPTGMPDPYGMSGGGLWQRKEPLKEGQLWTAGDLCLVGIQASWLSEVDFLKAVQIIQWCKMIAEEYDDLRDMIVAQVPRAGTTAESQ